MILHHPILPFAFAVYRIVGAMPNHSEWEMRSYALAVWHSVSAYAVLVQDTSWKENHLYVPIVGITIKHNPLMLPSSQTNLHLMQSSGDGYILRKDNFAEMHFSYISKAIYYRMSLHLWEMVLLDEMENDWPLTKTIWYFTDSANRGEMFKVMACILLYVSHISEQCTYNVVVMHFLWPFNFTLGF